MSYFLAWLVLSVCTYLLVRLFTDKYYGKWGAVKIGYMMRNRDYLVTEEDLKAAAGYTEMLTLASCLVAWPFWLYRIGKSYFVDITKTEEYKLHKSLIAAFDERYPHLKED